jgi:pimeloyl-ACP methyl ester carboxylesterase
MSRQTSPFDPNDFAEWLLQGFKEVVHYRVRQTLDRDRWMDYFKSKIPNKNQVVHLALKQAFLRNGFVFEDLKQGDATFHLIRKTWRTPPPGQSVRRLVFVPGFGDSPGSWLPLFTICQRELAQRFDEVLVIDFPGYMGFLSHHDMVASMSMLLSVLGTVVESNPPTALMGHSLGGWLAAKTAQDSSRLMEHLVLLAPSGLVPSEERKAFGDFIVQNQKLSLPELLELIVYDAKKFGPVLSREFKEFYERPSIREFVDSVQEEQFLDPKAPIKARRISLIWGDHDAFVPTHWMRHWIEHYGEYLDAYLLKDTGHIPQMEHPFVTARVLLHALFEKGGVEGRGWKKVQSRNKEYEPKVRASGVRALLAPGKP